MTDELRSKYLIDHDELNGMLAEPPKNLKIVDATFTPGDPEKAIANHVAKRITADTVHFDFYEIRDKDTTNIFMTPSLQQFKAQMIKLGIQKDHQIIVYDSSEQGILSAGKCAWMLRRHGAGNVRVLDGGLKKWQLAGRAIVENTPIVATEFKEEDGNYEFAIDESMTSLVLDDMHKEAKKLFDGEKDI